MTPKESVTVFPYYAQFEGTPKAREKYLSMRLHDDIRRAGRGRDPQVIWDDQALFDALYLIAKSVREFEARAFPEG